MYVLCFARPSQWHMSFSFDIKKEEEEEERNEKLTTVKLQAKQIGTVGIHLAIQFIIDSSA